MNKKDNIYRRDLNYKYQPDSFSLMLYDATFPEWLPERMC